VAHDLKNPLTTILGQAQILHRRLTRILNIAAHDAQETHELLYGLRTIEQQTRKVEVLINSLVEVSRIDLNRLELYRQEVDLLRLVQRAIKEYTPLTVKHTLRLYLDGGEISVNRDEAIDVSPVRVQGDERRLEQVVIHLLGNAVKYSPAGGQIRVSLRHRSEGVELTIEDQGIGIPKGEQAHITERFYRAENAVKAKIQGLGLGLYLVDMLVSKHGGSLSIESEGVPGKGSRVSISLPYRQT
jgi:signal transduction histidine kinase